MVASNESSGDGFDSVQPSGLPATGIGQGSFMPHLLHELRNLLAPLQNSLHVVRLSVDDTTKQAALAIMDNQIQALRTLLDNLAVIDQQTRLDTVAGDATFELTDVLHSVVEPARVRCAKWRQTFDFIAPTGSLRLRGSKSAIAHVLSALLENAARFTPEGGRIGFDVMALGGEVRLSIRDTGIGIPLEKVPHIYSRVEAGLALHGEGPHLGVSLLAATKIIGLHGGRIVIASEGSGQGTECVIHLPLQRFEASSPGSRMLDFELPAFTNSNTHARARVGPQRVLVVDDNRAVRESLSTIVEELGHDVKSAADGADGLRIAREWLPDLVLLDIHLPGLNGYEVARALRAQFASADMALIMIGGEELNDASLRGARDVGFDYCVDKMQTYDLLTKLLPSR